MKLSLTLLLSLSLVPFQILAMNEPDQNDNRIRPAAKVEPNKKEPFYILDFEKDMNDAKINNLIEKMENSSCERRILLENVRVNKICPFSNFFLSDSSGGYSLRLMSRNPSPRDLSQIGQGKLGLFCEGTLSYEEDQLYCKIDGKEKIHVAKSINPAEGLYPAIVDNIFHTLQYTSDKTIADAYKEALFQHTLLIDYTPSANTWKYFNSPKDEVKYYDSDGHKLLRAIVKGGVKEIYFDAYPDYFAHIDIEPDNQGLCNFGIDDAIEDRRHLHLFDKFMDFIKDNLVKEFHLRDGREWFFFSDFQNTTHVQKEIQINIKVEDCLKLNMDNKQKQEIFKQYEKKLSIKKSLMWEKKYQDQKESQRAAEESDDCDDFEGMLRTTAFKEI